jgi:hypothetical protein
MPQTRERSLPVAFAIENIRHDGVCVGIVRVVGDGEVGRALRQIGALKA